MKARQFSAALSRLTLVPSQIATPVARRIKEQSEKDFDRGVDPYGKTWQPLAESTIKRGRHPPPLTDTRDGRDSLEVFPTSGGGVQMTVGTDYMFRHQEGKGPPVRKFLPSGTLPKSYAKIWEEELAKRTKKTLDGK